jgi:hypothetical protein
MLGVEPHFLGYPAHGLVNHEKLEFENRYNMLHTYIYGKKKCE